MNNPISVRRALLSVSNKTGIVEFARALSDMQVEIISTGGTRQILQDANIAVRDISEITHFPEIMDGRVKTLHPKVHGGILGRRDTHLNIAKQHDIHWIDLVVVNLYPFAETIQKPNVTFEEAIENIDIGGPTMIRSAAKNMEWVGVVVDPNDYENILSELKDQQTLTFETRMQLAAKAFLHTAQYDAVIQKYLNCHASAFCHASESWHPDRIEANWMPAFAGMTKSVGMTKSAGMTKSISLRYGENPHQKATAYITSNEGVLSAKQHQGKELSYNNIVDADAAQTSVREFTEPACVIVKHANPCGVALAENIDEAFNKAFHADSKSAFGGIIALNRTCTATLANTLSKIFFEVLIAPNYDADALKILSSKPNLRVLELPLERKITEEMKFIHGGVLIQDHDNNALETELKIVTQLQPSEKHIHDMRFAWPVVKHIKSNAILIARNNVTLGIGAGQVSRIDAVDIALRKAGDDLTDAILASDAFFPFRDSIDRLANTGISAIIQPGGSVRDEEVIAACNEHGIAMVFTGVRCFKH